MLGTTPVLFPDFDNVDPAKPKGVFPDASPGIQALGVLTAGVYLATFSLTFIPQTNRSYEIRFEANGVVVGDTITLDPSNQSTLVTLGSAQQIAIPRGTVFQIFYNAVGTASNWETVQCRFSVMRISESFD